MDRKRLNDTLKNYNIEVPLFPDYIIPKGYLDTHRESHALFYYYINAYETYKNHILNAPIVLEGDRDPEYNFEQLITSIAALYGVQVEGMVKAWDAIDKQCLVLGLPLLPDEYQYRFVGKKGLQ